MLGQGRDRWTAPGPLSLLALAVIATAAVALPGSPAFASSGETPGTDATASPGSRSAAPSAAAKPPMRRVTLLGLRTRGNATRFARLAANPRSARYRQFAGPAQFRRRFSARPADRRRVQRFLRRQRGVRSVTLSSTRTTALVVSSPGAAKRLFCAKGDGVPMKGLCTPKRLRRAVQLVSVGESFETGVGGGGAARKPAPAPPASYETPPEAPRENGGSPEGCAAGRAVGGYTPNQLAGAYGTDELTDRGLSGAGIRVVTLSSQPLGDPGFETWAKCFGLPTPSTGSFSMPSANVSTAVPSNETALDVQALATLAPGLERITPIFVPLDQNFSHSFALFMFGALDRSRQGGRLPDLLSISDGVCEQFFSEAQLKLGERLLEEAAAMGVTALAAAGDAGFLGCEGSGTGASFPSTSPFVTQVGGTDLALNPQNRITAEVVWSTFATAGSEAVGTGGGPSFSFSRPGYQRAPGIDAGIQPAGEPTRLGPDLAAMASFTPGITTYNQGQGGWGADGGTSAATPLTAAIVALALEQESKAGRAPLGALPALLYRLARGSDYQSLFNDITKGTNSRKPGSAAGQTPAGGAAQPGYDLATGLGSLKATAFADAIAALAGG